MSPYKEWHRAKQKQGVHKKVAFNAHLFRGKEFKGIARSKIETEVTQFDTRVVDVSVFLAHLTKEEVPVFG